MERFKTLALHAYFYLAALDGAVAFFYLLSIPADPKNAWLFGLSRLRLVLVGCALFLSLDFFWLGLQFQLRKSWIVYSIQKIGVWLQQNQNYFSAVMICLGALVGWGYLYLLTIKARFMLLQATFERLAPLILWACILSTLTLILLLVVHYENFHLRNLQSQNRVYWSSGLAFILFLVILAWMSLTGVGVSPDVIGWGAPGTPLLAYQVILSLAVGMLLLIASFYIKPGDMVKRLTIIDVCLCLAIWLFASVLWWSTPLKPSYFAPAPTPPNFEYYPYSDAALHDMIAQNLLIGEGLGGGGGQVVRRPFYALFLAGLHLLGGQNYNCLVNLQIAVLALFPVLAYLLGKRLHSRLAGVMVAALLSFQEHNSIALSGVIDVSHSKLLMSDMPTTLGVILFTLIIVTWLRSPERYLLLPLLAGGALGALMLIRPQSLLLALAFGVAAMIIQWRHPVVWLRGVLFLIVGVCLCVLPWLARNWQITGTLVFDEPSSAQIGMVATRYSLDPAESIADALPGENGGDYSRRMANQILTFTLEHPGEVIRFTSAHFMHNLANLAATLPSYLDSIDLEAYVSQQSFWFPQGENPAHVNDVAVLLNLALIAVGIGSALGLRKEGVSPTRIGLIGIVPILIYLAYNLSNALARNSGWRFLFPGDWVGIFFFGIGLSQPVVWLFLLCSHEKPTIPFMLQRDESVIPIRRIQQGKTIWAGVALCVGILAFGSLLPLSERLAKPVYTNLTKEEMISLLGQRGLDTQRPDDFKVIQQLLSDSSAVGIIGRALYPRFYKAGQGIEEGSRTVLTQERDYNRIGFSVIGEQEVAVLLRLQKPPASFPNASDVLVFGCWSNQYLEASAVLVMDPLNPARDALYLQDPLEQLACH